MRKVISIKIEWEDGYQVLKGEAAQKWVEAMVKNDRLAMGLTEWKKRRKKKQLDV